MVGVATLSDHIISIPVNEVWHQMPLKVNKCLSVPNYYGDNSCICGFYELDCCTLALWPVLVGYASQLVSMLLTPRTSGLKYKFHRHKHLRLSV